MKRISARLVLAFMSAIAALYPATVSSADGPSVREIIITSDLDARKKPVDKLVEVASDSSFYVQIRWRDLEPNKKYLVSQFLQLGEEMIGLRTVFFTPKASSWRTWVNVKYAPKTLGNWALITELDGEVISEKTVVVSNEKKLAKRDSTSTSGVYKECADVSVHHDRFYKTHSSCRHDGESMLVNIDGRFWQDTFLDFAFQRIDRAIENLYFRKRGPKNQSRFWSETDFHKWGKKTKLRIGKKRVTAQRVMFKNEDCFFFVWFDHFSKGRAREIGSGTVCKAGSEPEVDALQEILESISLTEAY